MKRLGALWTGAVSYVALLLGAGLSIVFNVVDVMEKRGPALDRWDVLAAVAFPILVVLMVEMFVSRLWVGQAWPMQWLRWAGTISIGGIAMRVSWTHGNEFFQSREQTRDVAALGPLAVDLLAIMATALILSGRSPGTSQSASQDVPSEDPGTSQSASQSVPSEDPGTSQSASQDVPSEDPGTSQEASQSVPGTASQDVPERPRDGVPGRPRASQGRRPRTSQDRIPTAQGGFKELPSQDQERLIGEARARPGTPSYVELGREFGISKSEAGRLGKAYAERASQSVPGRPLVDILGSAGWRDWTDETAERVVPEPTMNGAKQ